MSDRAGILIQPSGGVSACLALALFSRALLLLGCSRPNEPSSKNAVVVRRIRHAGRSFTAVTVDLDRAAIRLFWKRPDGSRYGNFADLERALSRDGGDLLFATNAGIFGPAFTPCGLHVEDGRELVPLNLREGAGNFYLKPNGVFCVTDGGARVVESSGYAGVHGTVHFATQSGPLLLQQGRLHPRLNPDSPNRAVRSAVGVASPRSVVFVLSDEPVTFYELTTLLRDGLGCADALYLDGTISRFYAPGRSDPVPGGDFAGILAVTRRRVK